MMKPHANVHFFKGMLCLLCVLALALSGAIAEGESLARPGVVWSDLTIDEKIYRARTQYDMEYGTYRLWPDEIKEFFDGLLVEAGKSVSDVIGSFDKQGVLVARADGASITEAEAVDIAAAALGDIADVYALLTGEGYLLEEGDAPEYNVSFYTVQGDAGRLRFDVRVNGLTGEIVSMDGTPEEILAKAREAYEQAKAHFEAQMALWNWRYGEDMAGWTSEQRHERYRLLVYLGLMRMGAQDGTFFLAPSEEYSEMALATADEQFALSTGVARDSDANIVADAEYSVNDSTYTDCAYNITYSYNVGSGWYYIGSAIVFAPSCIIIDSDLHPDSLSNTLASSKRDIERERLFEEKGEWWTWSMDDQITYSEAIGDYDYQYPTEDDLARDKAISLARQFIIQEYGVTEDFAAALSASATLYVEGESANGSRIWLVFLYGDELTALYPDAYNPVYQLRISSPGGRLIDIFSPEGNG